MLAGHDLSHLQQCHGYIQAAEKMRQGCQVQNEEKFVAQRLKPGEARFLSAQANRFAGVNRKTQKLWLVPFEMTAIWQSTPRRG